MKHHNFKYSLLILILSFSFGVFGQYIINSTSATKKNHIKELEVSDSSNCIYDRYLFNSFGQMIELHPILSNEFYKHIYNNDLLIAVNTLYEKDTTVRCKIIHYYNTDNSYKYGIGLCCKDSTKNNRDTIYKCNFQDNPGLIIKPKYNSKGLITEHYYIQESSNSNCFTEKETYLLKYYYGFGDLINFIEIIDSKGIKKMTLTCKYKK